MAYMSELCVCLKLRALYSIDLGSTLPTVIYERPLPQLSHVHFQKHESDHRLNHPESSILGYSCTVHGNYNDCITTSSSIRKVMARRFQ
jgi:hypothetical protein